MARRATALLKTLRMPRVSFLIADDVGLGRTVDTGVLLTEPILRPHGPLAGWKPAFPT